MPPAAHLVTELARPEVNAVELEIIRKDIMAMADTASAELVETVHEVSVVLTPEQRQQIARHMSRHRH